MLAEKPASAAAQENLRLKIRTVWGFLAWSFLFFVVGVGFDIWSRGQVKPETEHPLLVLLRPEKMPGGLPTPKVSLGGSVLDFRNGRAEVKIASRNDLAINAEDLRDKVDERFRRTSLEQAVASPNVGVGNDAAAQSVGLTDTVVATAAPEEVAEKAAALEKRLDAPGAAPDPAAQASLGWAYFSLGKYDMAKANLEEAAAQAEDPATKARALQNLSRVLEVQGDFTGAKKVLENTRDASAQQRRLALERLEAGAFSPPPV